MNNVMSRALSIDIIIGFIKLKIELLNITLAFEEDSNTPNYAFLNFM